MVVEDTRVVGMDVVNRVVQVDIRIITSTIHIVVKSVVPVIIRIKTGNLVVNPVLLVNTKIKMEKIVVIHAVPVITRIRMVNLVVKSVVSESIKVIADNLVVIHAVPVITKIKMVNLVVNHVVVVNTKIMVVNLVVKLVVSVITRILAVNLAVKLVIVESIKVKMHKQVKVVAKNAKQVNFKIMLANQVVRLVRRVVINLFLERRVGQIALILSEVLKTLKHVFAVPQANVVPINFAIRIISAQIFKMASLFSGLSQKQTIHQNVRKKMWTVNIGNLLFL